MTEQHSEFETGQLIQSAAEIYDSFFVPALFQDWPKRILALTPLSETSRLLDVACGTGVLAREAARVSKQVTGVDLNDEMLAVARSRNQDIDWRQANAESLPFDDGQFDIVASQFGLMFYDDKIAAIREQYRVLAAGGTLAIAVWGPIDDSIGYAAMKALGIGLFGDQLAPGFDAPYVLGNEETLTGLFEQAGVPVSGISTLGGTARYPSIDDWVYTDIKGWTLAGALDDSQFEQLLEAANVELKRFLRSDGSVEFAVNAHIVIAEKAN